MGRPPLPIGERGNIKRKQLADGTWQALCRYRDADGTTRRVTAYGPSGQKAENALKRKLKGRRHTDGELTSETRVEVLAERWYATVDRSPGTRQAYRQTLDRHIIPGVGQLRIREATTARLDAFIAATANQRTIKRVKHGGPTAAKQARVVLTLMFGMAARYDAVPTNPVRDTLPPVVERKPIKAMSAEQFAEFFADMAAWAEGGTYGPKRNRGVLDVIDLFIGTGLRPGELLALQFQDVDYKAGTITVTGTIKRTKAAGLHRQAYPKSEYGERILLLPDFALLVVRDRQKTSRDKGGLIFTNRDGGIWEPANFSRLWVQARGDKWAWVKPSSFRKAVATLIERESDSMTAAGQLGHSSDAVTRRYYIERQLLAPDSRDAIQAYRGRFGGRFGSVRDGMAQYSESKESADN